MREIPAGFALQPDGSYSRPKVVGNSFQAFNDNVEKHVASVEAESALHDAIISHCKLKGWIYFHGSMAHRTFRVIGEPDFTILADGGRVLFVECKNAKGKLSPQQLGLKVWAEKLGHTIHTVRSMEEFLSLTARLD